MLYVLSGKGTVPPKEITAVMGQLLANAERHARDHELDEVDFWLAIDPDLINGDDPCWRALDKWATGEEVYIAAADDLRSVIGTAIGSGESVTVLALLCDPDFGPDDRDVAELIEWCPTNVRAFDLSGQMYEIELLPASSEFEEALEELVQGGQVYVDESDGVWPVYSRDDLEKKGRDDLKDIARKQGVVPRDWRSKESIIDSLLDAQSKRLGSDTPINVEEAPVPAEPELGAPEPEANPEHQSQPEDDISATVAELVRQELRIVLMDALNRLSS